MSKLLKCKIIFAIIALLHINTIKGSENEFMVKQSNHTNSNEKIPEVLMYETKPVDFNPAVEVAAIHVDVKGKILLLQLSSRKTEAGAWGVPGGKIEVDEQFFAAAKRELFEETGIRICANDQMQESAQLYFRKPDIDYVYHLFVLKLKKFPEIILSDEHQDYIWVTEQEAKELPLLKGGKEAIEFYFRLF